MSVNCASKHHMYFVVDRLHIIRGVDFHSHQISTINVQINRTHNKEQCEIYPHCYKERDSVCCVGHADVIAAVTSCQRRRGNAAMTEHSANIEQRR